MSARENTRMSTVTKLTFSGGGGEEEDGQLTIYDTSSGNMVVNDLTLRGQYNGPSFSFTRGLRYSDGLTLLRHPER